MHHGATHYLDKTLPTGDAPLEILPVGTNVVFTNDYGVSFAGKTIIRIEQDERGEAYYLSPSDAPWFPARRHQLTVEYKYLAEPLNAASYAERCKRWDKSA